MLGIRKKELRISSGLNQENFGKVLCVTKQSVSNWENCNILSSIDMLIKIAEMYSVSTDNLLGLSDKRLLDVSDLTNEQIAHIQNIVDDIRKNKNRAPCLKHKKLCPKNTTTPPKIGGVII